MLTLQILDSGRTFFRALDQQTLTLGSDPAADVRLSSPGVLGLHARIEPLIGKEDGWKIVDLDAGGGGTRVNGAVVAQWLLRLGDRIEIGDAVLVVGQRVRRAATPADVLEESPVATAAAELRRRDARREAPRPRWAGVGVVGIVVVVAIVALSLWGRTHGALPAALTDAATLRAQGKFDPARTLIARVRTEWAGDDAARHALLDARGAEIDAVESALHAGRARVRAEAAHKSRLEQLEELQAARTGPGDAASAEAAVILLSELTELRLGVERVADTEPVPVPEPAEPGPEGRPDPAAPVASRPPAEPIANADRFVQDRIDAITDVRGQGLYGRALTLLEQAIADTESTFADRLLALRAELRVEIEDEAKRLCAAARERAASGTLADLDAAIAGLAADAPRFPADAPFDAVLTELRETRARTLTAAEPAAPPSLADLRDLLAAARAADRAGDFHGAAAACRTGAERVRSSDPRFADELDGRAVDYELLADLSEFAREVAGRRAFTLARSGGGDLSFAAGPAGELTVTSAEGDEPNDWSMVDPAALCEWVRSAKAPPRAVIGAAIAAYRAGDRRAAEACLARLVDRDPENLDLVGVVIARGRGESVDARGYRLVKGEFVAARLVDAQRRAAALAPQLARLASADAEQRDRAVEAMLEKGPQELDAVVLALRQQLELVAARIDGHAFKRQYEQLVKVRRELDAARAFAKELIFDEERYFYPYKPPAVSADKANLYQKVQAEVDERVAAVRKLWNAKQPERRVPRKLAEDVAFVDWMLGVLAGFDERPPEVTERIAWARALPSAGHIGIRDVCLDEGERRERAVWERIGTFNERVLAGLPRAEAAQIRITNEYRAMFGQRPLAVNPKLTEAARSHAMEMSRLGYFSHFSPTPGCKTPYDRMRNAGYAQGISENIAMYPSAEAAHDGWIHSSGHHRNLLSPTHAEFAVGNDGRYWVQNFGRGGEYESDPLFRAAK